MHLLFRSKSSGLTQTKPDFNEPPLRQFCDRANSYEDEDDQEEDEEEEDEEEEEEEEEEDEEEDDEEDEDDKFVSSSPSTGRIRNYGNSSSANNNNNNNNNSGHQLPPILDIIMAALRRSLVTCSVDRDDVASIDISWPTEVKHVSHVTFDRFNGFLGLPLELQRKVPKRVPSASVSVFGVSAKSMQCSYDERGNSVPTILLRMQKRLYSEGGLKAEGIFRINAENSQEEFVRSQLNKGLVPNGIDVHCLAGLIKAWLRELPSGVLDALTPEQVMHCNTEEECTQLVKLLPQMAAALLDWSINLMADVVQHEAYNKMNARNIAMVFAPNMTQMADPLTALIHAVQVMNFLKTLILKLIREREELSRLHPPSMCMDYSPISSSYEETSTSTLTPAPTPNSFERERPISMSNLGSISLDRLQGKDMNQDIESSSSSSSSSSSPSKLQSEIRTATRTEFEVEERGDRGGDWLSWRKGVRKLCRHPVFQLTKQMSGKKTRSGEAWT